MNLSVNGNLQILLSGCEKNDRKSQKLLYKQFYGYAMSICFRYTHNEDDAMEVLNDAFMKVFTRIKQFDKSRSFKSWFRRILINTAIDHLKREMNYQNQLNIEDYEIKGHEWQADEHLMNEDLVQLIQKLSPAYRTVFNLFVIDGYSHEDISKMMQISVGTSKSNLAKARMKLREMLLKLDKNAYVRHAR